VSLKIKDQFENLILDANCTTPVERTENLILKPNEKIVGAKVDLLDQTWYPVSFKFLVLDTNLKNYS
jgi:hypothetical protein